MKSVGRMFSDIAYKNASNKAFSSVKHATKGDVYLWICHDKRNSLIAPL